MPNTTSNMGYCSNNILFPCITPLSAPQSAAWMKLVWWAQTHGRWLVWHAHFKKSLRWKQKVVCDIIITSEILWGTVVWPIMVNHYFLFRLSVVVQRCQNITYLRHHFCKCLPRPGQHRESSYVQLLLSLLPSPPLHLLTQQALWACLRGTRHDAPPKIICSVALSPVAGHTYQRRRRNIPEMIFSLSGSRHAAKKKVAPVLKKYCNSFCWHFKILNSWPP